MFASKVSRFSSSLAFLASRQIVKSQHAKEQIVGIGGYVRRSFGIAEKRHHDPFLVLDEFWVGAKGGFPDHPHRGFETVTYILEGNGLRHEDFAGHAGKVGPGDLQWMTAGHGILHSEMPVTSEASLASAAVENYDVLKDPNAVHGLQLWVNLSRKDKHCPPAYQDLKDAQIPRARPADGVEIKVIAGESNGVKSKIYTRTPTMYLDFKMQPNHSVRQSIPKDYSGFVYMLSGQAYFGEGPLPTDQDQSQKTTDVGKDEEKDKCFKTNPDPSVPFLGRKQHALILSEDDGTDCLQMRTADEGAHFILFAGQPLKEPIVQDLLFVMNSKEEVKQTIEDFKEAKNGFENAKNWKSTIAPKGLKLRLYK
ncbi:quercetin 2,3-dioxygenase [Entomortierella parvispora]|uniref:Quercetin 2,3-dioxygenase n=1 Tax=Entomortierella parvispora TaxID=205924 RepID=A0A9P3H5L2_9FUNG|nr:quercetin 2,3-dioxygenase [Entomortierella parvispora]